MGREYVFPVLPPTERILSNLDSWNLLMKVWEYLKLRSRVGPTYADAWLTITNYCLVKWRRMITRLPLFWILPTPLKDSALLLSSVLYRVIINSKMLCNSLVNTINSQYLYTSLCSVHSNFNYYFPNNLFLCTLLAVF